MQELPDVDDSEFDVAQNPNSLDELKLLVQQLDSLERKKTHYEEVLSEIKIAMSDISKKDIPELMESMGINTIGIPDSHRVVELKTWYHARLPKEEETREEAIEYLDTHGYGDLIKRHVGLQFPREEQEICQRVTSRIRQILAEEESNAEITYSVDIHWATYTSFAKSEIEKGTVLPLETLGIRVGREAKIKGDRNG